MEPARPHAGHASRLFCAFLVNGLVAGLTGSRKLCSSQRLFGCVSASSTGAGAARVEYQLGHMGRGRNGGQLGQS